MFSKFFNVTACGRRRQRAPKAEYGVRAKRLAPNLEHLAQRVGLPDLREHVHHTGRVMSVDPGEAAPRRDESVRIRSPWPPHADSGGYNDGLPIEQDLQMDVKMLRRQVFAHARHAVDDLSLVQIPDRGGQLIRSSR